jgi:hypothetical protein
MKKYVKLIVFTGLIILYLYGSVALAASGKQYLDDAKELLLKKRALKITDSSGVETELEQLTFEPKGRYYFRFSFPNYGSRFYLIKKPVELSIPMNLLISVHLKKETCEVEYVFMEKKQKTSGKFLEGKFYGESEFGNFHLGHNKIGKIIFTDPPISVDSPEFDSTLLLTGGTKLRARDLEIQDLFVQRDQDSTYINVYHTNTYVFNETEVKLKRGESQLSVPFNRIRKIEFLPDNQSIKIEMRTGKTIQGTCVRNDVKKKGTIEGFSGVCPEGGFFTGIQYIQSILFDK